MNSSFQHPAILQSGTTPRAPQWHTRHCDIHRPQRLPARTRPTDRPCRHYRPPQAAPSRHGSPAAAPSPSPPPASADRPAAKAGKRAAASAQVHAPRARSATSGTKDSSSTCGPGRAGRCAGSEARLTLRTPPPPAPSTPECAGRGRGSAPTETHSERTRPWRQSSRQQTIKRRRLSQPRAVACLSPSLSAANSPCPPPSAGPSAGGGGGGAAEGGWHSPATGAWRRLG